MSFSASLLTISVMLLSLFSIKLRNLNKMTNTPTKPKKINVFKFSPKPNRWDIERGRAGKRTKTLMMIQMITVVDTLKKDCPFSFLKNLMILSKIKKSDRLTSRNL